MKKFLFYLFAIFLILSIICNIGMFCKLKQPTEVKNDTEYVEKWDTIHDSFPVLDVRYEKIVKYIPIPDSILVPDTNTNEPVLPVIQRKYSDDSTYTAYVSGAMIDSFPRLDSIDVYQKTVYQTITNTIYKKRSRWSFGIQGGYGIGILSGKIEPYIGFGGTYSF